jgi:acetoin utilization deacetylase AcuC-like enzyme
MVLLYDDPRFQDHETGKHPERAERLAAIGRHLKRTGLVDRCTPIEVTPASADRLIRVHDPGYLEQLQEFASTGGGRIEQDTLVSPASYDVARLAAGAVSDATQRVLLGEAQRALCLVRPPGHHARGHTAMGFCLMNNVAIAARVATEEFNVDRVLIVDWDVHHGNATQETFWDDPRVGYFSVHRWPFYPGTGSKDETGSGDALGTILNLPFEFGTTRADYLAAFENRLEEIARRMRPELILLSAGFDSHRDDPVGSLGLETEDFLPLTRAMVQVADTYAQGRLVSVLEGGYNPGVLAGCIEVHLNALLDAETDRASGPGAK